MKKLLGKGVVMVVAFFILGISTSSAQGSVSLQVFYDELQPYGTWMDYDNYGYVWVPRVENDFTPYATHGYWIQTEYGNTWVSDYDWGWAPFHYGRWFRDDFYGWIWVPDTEWAPAWVAWRSGGGYYGWAPLMPGIAIHTSFHSYNRIPHHYWNFVPYRYVTYRHVYRHCAPRPHVVNIINHTTIITHNYTDNRRRTYFTGPSRHEIERRNHQRVEVHKIDNRDRPGRTEISRGTAVMYKPEIDNSRDSRTRSMPTNVVRRDRTESRQQVEIRNWENNIDGARFNREEAVQNKSRQSNDIRTPEGKRNPTDGVVQRRDYTTEQRQQTYERNVPSHRDVSRQREVPTRSRQDYNVTESTPQINREVQRREQFQRPADAPARREQVERRSTNSQQENVQRQRSYASPQSTDRSNVQRQSQFRESPDQPSRQPTRNAGESRQSSTRRRN